ncbi:hypothetical protein SLEP1_g12986 [Rubroshorea leprosula]|uniref:P-loop containing nucleoside triphosphate hydrolases superfamily protein n=1 Tax=Rubroshorea leprosula TaxID=152421 RepID=A0AAV5ING5_9ROSI|nr:hypothetical protein SLEP1_g12986 [Rubroshorea leprosula]
MSLQWVPVRSSDRPYSAAPKGKVDEDEAPAKKKHEIAGRGLIDLVFSWTIEDIRNNHLYKGQVNEIPDRFNLTKDYLKSFVLPLIEETHADLLSSLTSVSGAPSFEIRSINISKHHEYPKNLAYELVLGMRCFEDNKAIYEPEPGDLIALTDVMPKCIADLDRPNSPYLIAYVTGVDRYNPNHLSILSSRPIMIEENTQKNMKANRFVVFLTNMTTNIRIWRALNSHPEGKNMSLIKKVLQMHPPDAETTCLCEETHGADLYDLRTVIKSFSLNDSQEAAVLSCMGTSKCYHQNTVKLVWGPPGTGKTKTVGLLLYALLRMKCRTVTCAPTNTAVLQVTSRLMSFLTASAEYGTYGLGDIVLFGNRKRMQMDDHDDLLDIFLDYRAEMLFQCLCQWNGTLRSIIEFLEDPMRQYHLYLQSNKRSNSKEDRCQENDHKIEDRVMSSNQEKEEKNYGQNFGGKNTKKVWRKLVDQALKENKTNVKQVASRKGKHLKHKKKEALDDTSQEEQDAEDEDTLTLTLIEFVKKSFDSISQRLKFCIVNLFTHLPTLYISLDEVKKMRQAFDLLLLLDTSLNGLHKKFSKSEDQHRVHDSIKWSSRRKDCLQILKSLPQSFLVPDFKDTNEVKYFCLDSACLLFCTSSGSSKLHVAGEFDLLVIDEAAQLKECESTIPLQLPGLRHAILVGDELQLPAMVKSKISEKAGFGRSLFERLVCLGQKKHLLNIQYRMHPSISSFPNKEFYNKQILDAPTVKDSSYAKRFLHRNMYGSYSFINIACGKEQLDIVHSRKNMVEVAVVCEIVANLFKEFTRKKEKFSVGVISPYKAQVYAIEEKLGKKYARGAETDFSVRVRSIDGFQGDEEDLIIISTVRCNGNGSVGFLSNLQRTNVALTRARHCLWILGNEATLLNSHSVWEKVINDAKKRRCFYNADEDKSLAQAMTIALIELRQFDILINMDSLLFKNTRWKVCFSNGFWESVATIKNTEILRQLLTLLEKLSSGWRLMPNKKTCCYVLDSSSAFLEIYPVNDLLNLLWTVDIIEENSHYIQVLKVWNILPLPEVPKLAEHLDSLFENYAVDKINCCKERCLERSLVVPIRWPVNFGSATQSTGCEADSAQSLSKTFASLRITDESGASASTSKKKLKGKKKIR